MTSDMVYIYTAAKRAVQGKAPSGRALELILRRAEIALGPVIVEKGRQGPP